MKHDKGLLKADKLAAFREWLVAAGFEVRDGKGAFQCLQVKTSATCWAVVGRNTVGTLSTHPELRTLINRFNAGPATPVKQQAAANHHTNEAAFKNFHRCLCERFGAQHDPVDWWRDLTSLEEYIAALVKTAEAADRQPSGQFLEDLRDDFAMAALTGLLAKDQVLRLAGNGGGGAIGTTTPELAARDAYRFADAMLETRKVRP